MSVAIAVRIAAFLDEHHVVSLATYGSDGPHATSVLYIRDGLAPLWGSDSKSRRSAEPYANGRSHGWTRLSSV
jgi:nitroimidazol reductase NimA-like FMN-containing flavoprotein (pyridoxamine 5'-phosphate oxidase superfamily)